MNRFSTVAAQPSQLYVDVQRYDVRVCLYINLYHAFPPGSVSEFNTWNACEGKLDFCGNLQLVNIPEVVHLGIAARRWLRQ